MAFTTRGLLLKYNARFEAWLSERLPGWLVW